VKFGGVEPSRYQPNWLPMVRSSAVGRANFPPVVVRRRGVVEDKNRLRRKTTYPNRVGLNGTRNYMKIGKVKLAKEKECREFVLCLMPGVVTRADRNNKNGIIDRHCKHRDTNPPSRNSVPSGTDH